MDLAVTNEYAHSMGVWFGVANGTFLPPRIFLTGNTSVPTKLAKGDFNRDGRLDLAVVDRDTNKIIILINTCLCCTGQIMAHQ
jgi:hypothetical protein